MWTWMACKSRKEVSPLPLSNLVFFLFPLLPLIMKIINWNCRDALSPFFQSFVHDMVQNQSPAIMIITETKISARGPKMFQIGFLLIGQFMPIISGSPVDYRFFGTPLK